MHSIQQKQDNYNNEKLNNNSSKENPYDRLFNQDEPSLKTKFADVFNSLTNSFSQGQNEKASNTVASNQKANQKAQLDKENRLKEEDEKEDRKKIEQKKLKEKELAKKEQAQELKEEQYEEGFIERPSDILAATFAAQGLVGDVSNMTSGSAVASGSFTNNASGSFTNNASGSFTNSGSFTSGGSIGDEAQQEQDEASLKMAELENSQSDELDAIEERLNKLSREELNKQHNAYQDELQEQEHEEIARLNDKDLKKNLDNLARDANVSKISLKMDNPQTALTERRNAEAIANLPTSNPHTTGLKSLVAPNAVQNAVYNSLNHTPVSGSNSASISGSSTTNSTNVLSSDNKVVSRSAVAGMASAKLDTIGNTNLVADRAAIKENIKLNQAAEALSIAASKLGAVDRSGFGIGSEASKVSAQSVDNSNDDEFNFKAKDVIASLQEVADDLEADKVSEQAPNFKQSAFGRAMSPLMAEADALASMDMSVAAKALAKGLSHAIYEHQQEQQVESDNIVNAVKDKELQGSSKAVAAALKLAQAVEHHQGESNNKASEVKHNNNIVIDKDSSAYKDNSSKASLIALAEQTQKTPHKMPDLSLDEYTARSSLTNDASLYKAKNSSSHDSVANALSALKNDFNNATKEAQAPEDQGQELDVFTKGAKTSAVDTLLSSQQNSMQRANGDAFVSFAGSIGTFSDTNVALNPHDSANLAARYGGMTFSESLNNSGVANLYEVAAKKAREILELNYAQKQGEDNSSHNNMQAANMIADNMAQEANIAKHNDLLDFNKPSNALLNMYLAPDPSEAAAQINERVLQMAARNMRHLTVELNPNELGKMRISIDMSANNEALAVSLAAVDQNTREALEQSLPKLKEILAQQNIFTDAQVVELKEQKLAANQDEISAIESA